MTSVSHPPSTSVEAEVSEPRGLLVHFHDGPSTSRWMVSLIRESGQSNTLLSPRCFWQSWGALTTEKGTLRFHRRTSKHGIRRIKEAEKAHHQAGPKLRKETAQKGTCRSVLQLGGHPKPAAFRLNFGLLVAHYPPKNIKKTVPSHSLQEAEGGCTEVSIQEPFPSPQQCRRTPGLIESAFHCDGTMSKTSTWMFQK